MLSKEELLASLKSVATAQGVSVSDDGDSAVRGQTEAIRSRWFLGGNKSVYSFSCRLDEPTHVATFREIIADKTWGVAPPTLKVERYSQRRAAVFSSRHEVSVGGGGVQAFGRLRDACAEVVTRAGWQFNPAPLHAP